MFGLHCIVDVISMGQYRKFEKELRKIGFVQPLENEKICRWHYEEIILDIMPADKKILGFDDHWYKEALKYSMAHKISNGLSIKSVTAPYFLATKIEAYRARGNNDLLSSSDFEDIITVIDGRAEICDELAIVDEVLKAHLKKFFKEMLSNDQFDLVLQGHLNDGPITMQKVHIVMSRIREIVEI